MEDILVSISCTTFNHMRYIRECLDGFLKQQCNFEFEVLIHDDASTDGTIDIIKEYQRKYPEIIKPYIQKENQWSKGVRGMNAKYNFSRAMGTYIAMCEGDDYWTDPLKLQKQVDFLEDNPDSTLCFTNADVKNEEGISHHYARVYDHLRNKEYSGQEIYNKWTIPTASVMFRKPEQFDLPTDNRFIYGDTILFLWLAEKGRLKCLNEKMVVYRRNKGGVTFGKKNYKKIIAHHEAIKEHFGEKYYKIADKNIETVYVNAFLSGKLGQDSLSVLKDLYRNPHFLAPFVSKLPIQFSKSLKNKIW